MSSEDKYDTLEKIGHGSFGIIRKVRRKTDGFIMCRKEISYLRMSQKEREQLHAEFQILSHLRHPNIVAYYHREHLKQSQDLHLYMEYCGNGDLGRVILDLQSKNQYAQESFVWSIASQLIMALYRCHYGQDPPEVGSDVLGLKGSSLLPKVPAGTMTILHRDLKPENVFLGEDNSVKLGDFGLSKMIKSHDFASTYVGTPFYMSPEICAAEKYTLKSDIWSLGCIIYELCSREPPFNAKTHFQLVQKIKEGRTSPLPDVYSAELGSLINKCLNVNPNKRPDTAELLQQPVIRLMRKEKEVVDLRNSIKGKEELVLKREKEISLRLSSMDKDREMIREELENSIRREWEVKARLEIDRLVKTEVERLQRTFDSEVQIRVDVEVAKKTVSFAPLDTHVDDHASSVTPSEARSDHPSTSGDELSSMTDMTEYSTDSPDTSTTKEVKKTSRTPFGRAQTMFVGAHAGTPMDIEMVSPSPIAIASLSLSPRRTGTTKPPTTNNGNIFAVNAANNSSDIPSWTLPREPRLLDSDDDDEEDLMPSPTRQIKSIKNPFTSKTRPVLVSQKSCPINRLKPQGSSSGFVSKIGLNPPEPRSPTRRLSKIPSASNLQSENNSAPSVGGLTRRGSFKKENTLSGEALNKVAAKNNIKGRTLVELQQARAGGRPMSAVNPDGSHPPVSPKRRTAGERRASGDEPAAVWDPERDDMPSPFLVRHRRIAKV